MPAGKGAVNYLNLAREVLQKNGLTRLNDSEKFINIRRELVVSNTSNSDNTRLSRTCLQNEAHWDEDSVHCWKMQNTDITRSTRLETDTHREHAVSWFGFNSFKNLNKLKQILSSLARTLRRRP
jgi:hypothetical protein